MTAISFHIALLSLFGILLSSLNCYATCKTNLFATYFDKNGEKWVDSVYNTLNETQRIAQLFMPVVEPGDSLYGLNSTRIYVEKYNVGGLLVGKGTATEYADLVNQAQKMSKVPLLTAIDGEWGVAMRVTDAIKFPRNLALGAISDDKLIYQYGKIVGEQCNILGIHINFAPVVDINSNPDNPVIGNRSFGETPLNVANKAVSFAKGLESQRVLSVAKHFPGHGSTYEDSHKTLPILNKSAAEISLIDLYPFRKYIDAGLGGILTAHLNIPALTHSQAPTSLSKTVVKDLLQSQLHFDGLIITDALTMKGATSTSKSVCVEALAAGNEILLSPHNIGKEIKAIAKAIDDGELDSMQINNTVKKILAYKYILNAHKFTPIDTTNIAQRINSSRANQLNEKLVESSITIVKDSLNLVGKHNNKAHIIYLTEINETLSAQLSNAGKSQTLTIVVALMEPYKLAPFADLLKPNNISLIIAYNNTVAARNAANKVIEGKLSADAHLPVTIKNLAPALTGITKH